MSRAKDTTALDHRSASLLRSLVGALLLLAPVAAVAAGAWMLLQGREAPLVQAEGNFTLLAEPDPGAAARPHPLLATDAPTGWSWEADSSELGRNGTSVLDDARLILGRDLPDRAAVPVAPLRSGAIAWASPHAVRLVDVAGRQALATAGGCDAGIDATASADGLLLVASCGRLAAIGPQGTARWTIDLPAAAEGSPSRTHLLAADGDVVAGVVGSDRLVRVDAATGRAVWRVDVGAPIRHLRRLGKDRVVVGTHGEARGIEQSELRSLALEDGSAAWSRRWRGWRATAVATDNARVVAALVQDAGADGRTCQASGIVELGAAGGATRSTRSIDRQMVVRDLRVEPRTGRMAALVAPRGCAVASAVARIDLLGARGLTELHRQPLPARPCSGLATNRGLVAAATCGEVVAVDALSGKQRWTVELPEAPTRRATAVTVTGQRVAVTDDVGSLQVLEAGTAAA